MGMIPKIILYAIAAYILLLAILYIFQRQLTYFPSSRTSTPEDAGVPEMTPIELKTADGLALTAWYKKPRNEHKPTILYLHGNAGSIGNRGFIVRPFLDQGYGVLLLTYRGYSGNPGSPSEEGLYSDARAAMEFLSQSNCVVLYGNSIGGAVAVQIASEYPVKALILQSTFTSLADVSRYHYPFFTIGWLMKDRYLSIDKISKLKVPIMLLHGEDDTIIPPDLSRLLYEKIEGPKEIHLIPQRGHNTLFEPELVSEFIEKHVQCP